MQTSERTLYKLRKQRAPRCPGLRYSARMSTRRRHLGEYVRAAREAQGYPSMRSFAEAIDISPRSVAKVENGEDDAGSRVMRAVARGLGWPSNSLAQYLRTGDATVLAPSEVPEPKTAPEPVRDEYDEMADQLTDLIAKLLDMQRRVDSMRHGKRGA